MTEYTFEDVLSELKLTNLITGRLNAERFLDESPFNVNLETGLGYSFNQNMVAVNVKSELQISTESKGAIANVTVAVAAIYQLENAEEKLKDRAEFLEQLAMISHLACHPYIRSHYSNLGSAIGFPNLTLGLLRLGRNQPDSIAILDRVYTFDQK